MSRSKWQFSRNWLPVQHNLGYCSWALESPPPYFALDTTAVHYIDVHKILTQTAWRGADCSATSPSLSAGGQNGGWSHHTKNQNRYPINETGRLYKPELPNEKSIVVPSAAYKYKGTLVYKPELRNTAHAAYRGVLSRRVFNTTHKK